MTVSESLKVVELNMEIAEKLYNIGEMSKEEYAETLKGLLFNGLKPIMKEGININKRI